MKNSVLFLFLSFLLCASVNAQQSLNLNFEKVSVEGFSRPWGWDNDLYSENAEISLDSIAKYSGKYSIRMKGNHSNRNNSFQSLILNVETFSLRNKKVKIGGWIKTENLMGSAFFTVNYLFDLNGKVINKCDTIKTKFSGTNNWVQSSISIILPASVTGFAVTLMQSGEGSAWFDDFTLTVDGKISSEVQVAQPFSSNQLKWFDQHSTIINSVDASTGDQSSFEDLKSFGKIVGDASIIALGESTHGTSEFFRMKSRLLEYSVKVLGVRIFGLEDNQLIVERVNKYVQGGKGTARNSMYGLFSVWQNQEVLDLIKWVRKYNDMNPNDKVEFLGFDMQDPKLAYDSLNVFLKKFDQSIQGQVNILLMNIKKDGANSYATPDSIKLLWFQDAKKAFDLVHSKKQTWLASAKNKKDTMEIEWGMQYATLVKQFAENAYKGHMSLYRDVAMAENIGWILSMHKPSTRMVIWAHDNHISKGEDPLLTNNYYNGISMGAHLSKKYGTAYKAFGQYTYSGEYFAQISYSNFKQINCPLFPGPKGSLDEALHLIALQKKSNVLLLDLTEARKVSWLATPLPVRFANHVCMEYSYWSRFSIPYQFDGIFFMDKTTAARPAENN